STGLAWGVLLVSSIGFRGDLFPWSGFGVGEAYFWFVSLLCSSLRTFTCTAARPFAGLSGQAGPGNHQHADAFINSSTMTVRSNWICKPYNFRTYLASALRCSSTTRAVDRSSRDWYG
ncbi:hypothetical protein EDB85DRAFT_2050184, partial [Lactarius pseudohatsudake]